MEQLFLYISPAISSQWISNDPPGEEAKAVNLIEREKIQELWFREKNGILIDDVQRNTR